MALTDPGQTDPEPFDYFQDTTRTFTYNPFTVVPSFCDVQVSCIGVNPPTALLGCTDHDLVPDQSTTWKIDETAYLAGLIP